jgi:YHS domain-containing protein
MKLKLTIIMAAAGLGILLLRSPGYAEDKGSISDGQLTAEVTESGAIKVGNTICPVSKKKVGEMGEVVEYEYNGKVYNFCCKACLKDFEKDPEKYVKIVEEMMAGEKTE